MHYFRSAALFHLKKYSSCLRDIELAFESGYPADMHHKLYERRGTSLRDLGRTEEALASYRQAVDSLSLASLSEKARETRNQALEKLIDACQKGPGKLTATDDTSGEGKMELPGVTGEKNPIYPQMSKSVKVEYNNVVGRHTVAARDIKVGDVVISENPYAAVVLPSGLYNVLFKISLIIVHIKLCIYVRAYILFLLI